MDINAYQAATSVAKAGGYSVNSTQKGATLDMQDFLNLLTAQLANQDVMNPSTDTEFIAQMAQFTSLQAMQTLTELSYAQYGASMIGKNVIVATVNKRGELVEETGEVTNVKFMDGTVSVTVNGTDYDMSAIMEVVGKTQTAPPKEETPDPEEA